MKNKYPLFLHTTYASHDTPTTLHRESLLPQDHGRTDPTPPVDTRTSSSSQANDGNRTTHASHVAPAILHRQTLIPQDPARTDPIHPVETTPIQAGRPDFLIPPNDANSASSHTAEGRRNVSGAPPPAYTPRPEHTIPGIHVTRDGSPRRNDQVEVAVDIRWPDQTTKYPVERGTQPEQLKTITPVKNLLNFGEAAVNVSPPESAKSGTKVHVDSSYEALLARTKDEFEAAMEVKQKMREQAWEMKLETKLKANTNYFQELIKHLCMRQIQDGVYSMMSSSLGKKDFKSWGSFEKLVDEFVSCRQVEFLLPSDIEHLKAAKGRKDANSLAHPDLTDDETMDYVWRGLESTLAAAGENDIRNEYERYVKEIKAVSTV